MHTTPSIAILLIVSLWNSSQAQDPAQVGGPLLLTFETLKDSQWVRLASPELGRHEGRVLGRSSTELVLSSQDQPLRVPAVTVDTLWTRGNSALAGGIVGAVVVGALGAGAGALLGEEDGGRGSAENVLGMAGIGAVGGFLLGAVIGTAIPRWHRRHP